MGKKLRRSKENRVIAGVCGGIAEYFATDPTIIRLIWAAFALTGTGIIVYIVAAIIMPERDGYSSQNDEYDPDKEFKDYTAGSTREDEFRKPGNQNRRTMFGIIMVLLGVMFFAQRFFSWLSFQHFVPLILIFIGILIIFNGGRKNI